MAPKPPQSLIRHISEGRCVLFVGSGLSKWGGLPLWDELLREMVDELRAEQPDRSDLDELDRLVDDGKLLEVADYCREQLKTRYTSILSDRLRGGSGELPAPHKIIVQLPFRAMVTTNYDKLLERAYSELRGGLPKTPNHRSKTLGRLLFDGGFFIMKAHGDIDEASDLVLTSRDYQEIIHTNLAFNQVISTILQTNAILFLGYSLTDPDFRLLLDRQLAVFKEDVPPRYALMSGVGPIERDVLLRTAGISVLSYDKDQHGQVLEFLQDLQRRVHEEQLAQEPARPKQPRPVIEAPPAEPKRPSALPTARLSIKVEWPAERTRPLLIAEILPSGHETVTREAGLIPDPRALTLDLQEAAQPFSAGDADNRQAARRVATALAHSLPDVILQALLRVPQGEMITLELSEEVETLPWEWLLVEDTHLFLRNPVVRAPVGISNAARGYPQVRTPLRVLLLGDPTSDLIGAREEVETIAKLYHTHPDVDCKTLIGPDATSRAVFRTWEAGLYDVVHFAGHAWVDDQDSYLTFHEQTELRASDLRSFLSPQPPSILVLNSHFTAFVPLGGIRSADDVSVLPEATRDLRPAEAPTVPGKRGFTDAASTAGVGAFVGCIGSPSDRKAALMGIELHKALLNGAPVAKALHQARLIGNADDVQGSDTTELLYLVSGYPELTLV